MERFCNQLFSGFRVRFTSKMPRVVFKTSCRWRRHSSTTRTALFTRCPPIHMVISRGYGTWCSAFIKRWSRATIPHSFARSYNWPISPVSLQSSSKFSKSRGQLDRYFYPIKSIVVIYSLQSIGVSNCLYTPRKINVIYFENFIRSGLPKGWWIHFV